MIIMKLRESKRIRKMETRPWTLTEDEHPLWTFQTGIWTFFMGQRP